MTDALDCGLHLLPSQHLQLPPRGLAGHHLHIPEMVFRSHEAIPEAHRGQQK